MQLDKEKGVNPFRTYCPRCGGEGRELILVGNRQYTQTCPSCGVVNFGGVDHGKCGHCQGEMEEVKKVKIPDGELLPGGLCEKCEKEVKEFKELVAAGGIYWKCKCGAGGVVKANTQTAVEFRKAVGVEAPEPVGMKVENCPRCMIEGEGGNA
jgi:hypothetical protein